MSMLKDTVRLLRLFINKALEYRTMRYHRPMGGWLVMNGVSAVQPDCHEVGR